MPMAQFAETSPKICSAGMMIAETKPDNKSKAPKIR